MSACRRVYNNNSSSSSSSSNSNNNNNNNNNRISIAPYGRNFRGRRRRFSRRHYGSLRGSSSPFIALSRRWLNPIKPVYDPDRPDGRLNLTASAFNQLGQYRPTKQSWSQGLLLRRTRRFLL